MRIRVLAVLAIAVSPGFCADWNAKAAADYLDSRQKDWFAWPTAKAEGGPCLSCHTGLTYLLARPALGRKLGEAGPSDWQTGLLEGVKHRVLAESPKPSIQLSVETVFLSLFYALEDSKRGTLRPETERVFQKLWARQVKEGDNKGSWNWYNLNLDPWETQVSPFYAAGLAALAVGTAPRYATQPGIQENLTALKGFLATHQEGQPFQNRLLLLWAFTKMPDLLSKPQREALVKEAWDKQEPDGGWTNESFGAWNKHADAPGQAGSNGYATAFVAFALERAGIARSDKRLNRALQWLESHQAKEGYWDAQSLNKHFPQGAMEIQFMRDAATSFAVLALLDVDPARRL
jgi:hypothetical protein